MGGRTSAASHNKYNAKAYDRVNLVVPKGQKEQIQEYAKEHSMSLNSYINNLIKTDIGDRLTPGGVVKNIEGMSLTEEKPSCLLSPAQREELKQMIKKMVSSKPCTDYGLKLEVIKVVQEFLDDEEKTAKERRTL